MRGDQDGMEITDGECGVQPWGRKLFSSELTLDLQSTVSEANNKTRGSSSAVGLLHSYVFSRHEYWQFVEVRSGVCLL